MPQPCTICGTEIGPRDSVCRICGTAATLPASHGSGDAGAAVLPPAPAHAIPDTFLIMPQATQQSRSRQRFVRTAGRCVTAALVVGVIGWPLSALWRMGPGAEIAFQQQNKRGNEAFERGDFTDADAHYSEMIALRPSRVDGYLLRAINDVRQGLFPQAIRDNTEALAQNPDAMQRGSLYHNRADAYLSRRAWDKAAADFSASEQAYIQASADPQAYAHDLERLPGWIADNRRGHAHASMELKKYPQAIEDYSANIKAGYIRPEDYGMRATAEEALGLDTEAISDYGKAISTDAGYMYGFQKLNSLTDKAHCYAQAASAYRQAANLHPESVVCWGSLGWQEYLAGHISAAIVADQQALSLDPNQDWIHFNVGLCYATAGDSAQARKAYAAALAGQDKAGRIAALKDLRTALVKHPGSPSLQSAVKQIEAAIAQTPSTPAATGNATPLTRPQVDPKFETLLAPDTTQRGYTIRPPAGYALKQAKSAFLSGAQDVDYWRGPARPDGSAPDLQVEVITDDGRMAAASSPRQHMQRYFSAMATNHAQFKASAITSSTIGARTFLKATWSGIGVKTGKQFNGFVYIASQTGEYISIVAHDTAPGSADTLPLLEASAHTFHK